MRLFNFFVDYTDYVIQIMNSYFCGVDKEKKTWFNQNMY